MSTRERFCSVLVLALALWRPNLAHAAPKPPLILGISQLYGAQQAAKVAPAAEPYLTRVLQGPISVKVFADADELATALATKQVDLAWLPPLAFVHAVQQDPEVLALSKAMRHSALTYRAVLFVKAEAPFKTVADLKGRTIAYVAKSSASGYLFARELVRREGLDPGRLFATERFEGDHPAVCRAVKAGVADVGATYAAEADARSPQVNACGTDAAQFRVLSSTGNVPNEVIAARSDFPPERVPDVLAAFAHMGSSEDGKRALTEAFDVDGWGVAVEGDFEPVLDLVRSQGARPRVAKDTDSKKKKKR